MMRGLPASHFVKPKPRNAVRRVRGFVQLLNCYEVVMNLSGLVRTGDSK
jgi:hypothetical protein